jgi:hypothetical protein
MHMLLYSLQQGRSSWYLLVVFKPLRCSVYGVLSACNLTILLLKNIIYLPASLLRLCSVLAIDAGMGGAAGAYVGLCFGGVLACNYVALSVLALTVLEHVIICQQLLPSC